MRRGTRISSLASIAITAILGMLAPPGRTCGYEDPQSIAMGALSLAFPDSLHLRTAIWQAQLDGVLPRDPPSTALASSIVAAPYSVAAPVTGAAARNGQATDPTQVIALMEALRVIEQMRLRLATATDVNERPPIAMVYASKMLWTRFLAKGQGVSAQTHAAGPESGDIVLITEPVVIQAMVTGSLKPDEALRRMLLRLYGDESASASAREWLQALAAPSSILLSKE